MTLNLDLRIVLVLVSMLLSTACASRQDISRVKQQSTISSQDAVRLATEEIRKRGLIVKSHWSVKVEDSLVEHEFQPPRQIFTVSFHGMSKGKRSAIYRMNIDKLTGNVEDFIDMRTVIRIR